MFTIPPNTRPFGRVFLSSPFSERRGHLWLVRRQLYDRLRMCGFKPWMWEEEGEREKARHGWTDTTILLEALKGCDVVVAFFKNRAGSYLPDEAFQKPTYEPFLGSVFEICHARALGKPVHLYAVGHSYKASLASVLSVLADPLLLPDHAKILGSETELPDAVTEKLLTSLAVVAPEPTRVLHLDLDPTWLEETRSASMESAATFWEASYHAAQVPLVRGLRLPTRPADAEVLAAAAGVLANQASYDRAIEAATLSVRCFLELGSWFEMYAEIQALSGILNMAGRPNAERVNHFGRTPHCARIVIFGLRSSTRRQHTHAF